MKSLYNAPEAEILEIKLATNVCELSQGGFDGNVPGDPDEGDEI